MTAVTLKLVVTVHKERDQYVAICPDFHVASQGKTGKEAISNAVEALKLFLEDEDVQKEYSEEIRKCMFQEDLEPRVVDVEINDKSRLTNIIGV